MVFVGKSLVSKIRILKKQKVKWKWENKHEEIKHFVEIVELVITRLYMKTALTWIKEQTGEMKLSYTTETTVQCPNCGYEFTTEVEIELDHEGERDEPD